MFVLTCILDNPHFIYALLRHSQKFKRLADFNLNSALNERPAKDGSREEEGISEKAKGKLPENSASLSSSSSPSPSSQENLTHFSGGKNGFVPSNEWVSEHVKIVENSKLIVIIGKQLAFSSAFGYSCHFDNLFETSFGEIGFNK